MTNKPKAISLLEQAFKLSKIVFGKEHLKTISIEKKLNIVKSP